MMKLLLAVYIPCILALIGCDERFDIYSPGQIHRTVQAHPSRDGVYIVYYRWDKVIKEYGPGLETVREAVISADEEDKLAIWENTMASAVPKYLRDKDLIPADCVHGVVVVSSNKDEGGGGATAFRCKSGKGVSTRTLKNGTLQ